MPPKARPTERPARPVRSPKRTVRHTRNLADTGDLIQTDRADIRVVLGDDGTVTVFGDGLAAELEILDNARATAPDEPARATVRVRMVAAPYVAPGEPAPPLVVGPPELDPGEGEPDA